MIQNGNIQIDIKISQQNRLKYSTPEKCEKRRYTWKQSYIRNLIDLIYVMPEFTPVG